MALFLDRNDPKPLYEQIYRNIREDIENGALRTGTALPSRREMASQCGVSVNTVENAYAQLVAEGFIGAEPKIGYFVEPMGRSRLNTFPEEYTPISPEPSIIGDNSIYDCRFGRIDESAFPHRLWRRCLQGALEKPGALQRGDPQGELLLRQALCGYLHRQRGVVCDPSRVVIGPGLEWLILSLLPFFPEKSLFGMEDPGYTPYRKLLNAYGRKVLTVPSTDGGVNGTALHLLKPHVLYLSPSHRFPMGGVLSAGTRREVLEWASWCGATVLEDDYDSELRYKGLPIPSLQSMDGDGRVVYLGSFSECLSPGLRIGYMVLPQRLSEKLQTARINCAVSVPAQLALASFILEGHMERHVAKVRTLYRRRRETLLELFKSALPCVDPEDDGAGLFLRLRVRIAGYENRCLNLAKDAGVLLTGISQFYENPDDRVIRVLFGFGGLPGEALRPAVERLRKAWTG